MSNPLDTHYRLVIKSISEGRVVPFLGAGANLCGRPPEVTWEREQREYLPSGGELAEHLAESHFYPADEARDLARVSQYVDTVMGSGELYGDLRGLFNRDYPPTRLHEFLAALPRLLREKGYPRTEDPLRRRFVIITTNYDDMLERAFNDEGEPFHLVSYVAKGEQCGKFWHLSPAGEPHLIDMPNQYNGLLADPATVILKIHGAVDRADDERDSFVITEDHYIDYLTRTDIASLIPVPLPAKLKKSHLLFLGYGLRDWNLRVILHRIWGGRVLSWKSWAVQLDPDSFDKEYWGNRHVEIVETCLKDYVAELGSRMQDLPHAGGEA
jgi:hypothetical protein